MFSLPFRNAKNSRRNSFFFKPTIAKQTLSWMYTFSKSRRFFGIRSFFLWIFLFLSRMPRKWSQRNCFFENRLLRNKLLPECLLSQNPEDFVRQESFFSRFFSSFLECRENDRRNRFFKNRLLWNKLLPDVCFLKVQKILWDKKLFSQNLSLNFLNAEKMIAAESFFQNRLLRNKLLPECILTQNPKDVVG